MVLRPIGARILKTYSLSTCYLRVPVKWCGGWDSRTSLPVGISRGDLGHAFDQNPGRGPNPPRFIPEWVCVLVSRGMTGPEVIGNGKDISSRDGPTSFNGKAETCNHKDAALVPAQVFFDDVLLNTHVGQTTHEES